MYLMTTVAEDEENQKRGFVGVIYHVNEFVPEPIHYDLFFRGPLITKVIPIRVASVHHCIGNKSFMGVLGIVVKSLGSLVQRYRMYHGKHEFSSY